MIRIIGLLFVLSVFAGQASAQCKTFAKNKCMPSLDDYMLNGRLYASYMRQGQESELNLVLNGGQKYRLIACAKESLGNVWVRLTDASGKVLYDNAEHDFANTWDFSVKSTQEFKVKTFIQTPKAQNELEVRDCSVILVGSKIE